METYSIVLKHDGKFDLPNDPGELKSKLPAMLLDKLEGADFKIIHVEASHSDEIDHPFEFMEGQGSFSVLNFRIPLPAHAVGDEAAMYKYCVEALSSGLLYQEYTYENESADNIQSTIGFRVRDQYVDLVFEDYETIMKHLNLQ